MTVHARSGNLKQPEEHEFCVKTLLMVEAEIARISMLQGAIIANLKVKDITWCEHQQVRIEPFTMMRQPNWSDLDMIAFRLVLRLKNWRCLSLLMFLVDGS